ncbi:XTP/dITP diphosphohydrolase [Paenibacillus sp. 1_12]|uniref:non-canonical purine NTP pyrophosphatase n=1 Tax=Paenibacillus sp. 1_12 TaxID=1566278 RepID=UPI0008EDBA9A|nr:non-canonical purine NTP pyrophosphatase [Paenibacillus sp. 1_12]SFK70764.1 XTP/dITP diphosphohydrolase [Paenibacillus sp. 1_12]
MRQLLGAEIVVATSNEGKVREFAALFSSEPISIKSLRDYSGLPEIVEDGATFAENAYKKAHTIALSLGVPVVADDSGLCVDALNGEPGVYSARYAGERATDEQNNNKLLKTLLAFDMNKRDGQIDSGKLIPDGYGKGEPSAEPSTPSHNPDSLSRARFVCALCLVDASGQIVAQAQGECEGEIINAPRGNHGFGYDPLFYIPEYGQTMAELSSEQKNRISHRGHALQSLMEVIATKS